MTKTTDIYFPTDEIEKIFVKSIWRLTENDLAARKEIILPKGTVEIIFNFANDIFYHNQTLHIPKILPVVFVNGINFKPFELIKTGHQDFLGVQLNGIGFRLLFNISVKEFNDNIYEGSEINWLLKLLADELYCCQTFSQQIEIIRAWIRKQSPSMSCQYSIHRAQRLLSLINGNNLTVKKISEEICLSDRQLRRFSTDWLGMNTEKLTQYSKYLACLYAIHQAKNTLTDIGLEAGYYDQSHFIREFKSYTNMTPKQYGDADAEYPGHILLKI